METKIEFGNDYHFKIDTDTIAKKKDTSYFVDNILSRHYFDKDLHNDCPAKLPFGYDSSKEYLDLLVPCFFEECHSKIETALAKFHRENNHEQIKAKLGYL